MKTIGIDCRFASTQSGLGRYTRELISHLVTRNDSMDYVLYVRDANESWLRPLSSCAKIVTADFQHYSFKEQIGMSRMLNEPRVDMLFSTHFNVPLVSSIPFVVTIHDLILHRYPNRSSYIKRYGYKKVMKHAVRKAQRIIAISNFVADEICKEYGERMRPKITVIYEGISDIFRKQPEEACAAVRMKHNLEKPFFLYVGNAKQHKNVQLLIDAFNRAAVAGTELILVTGGKEASKLKLRNNVRIIYDISDKDLPALYSAATCFVTSSLYEGFCLPIIESRACGCPVIAANTAAIPEAAGPETLLLDPTLDAFSAGFQSPPNSAVPPEFSWDDTAEQTLAVLQI